MCEEAHSGPAWHDSSWQWHRMWKGYKIPWVSLSIASWDFWPLFIWPSHNYHMCFFVCACGPPECTLDRHFVFSVPTSLTEPPLSPSLLVAAGNSTCKPQRVTTDYAFFKIPMDGCGTRRVVSFNEWKHFQKLMLKDLSAINRPE